MTTVDERARERAPTLPEAYIDSLVDTGHWRQVGVTHWHLWSTEQPLLVSGRPNAARFTHELLAGHIARGEPCHDPREALRWVYRRHLEALMSGSDPAGYAQQAGWHNEDAFRFSIGVSWEFMTDKPHSLTPIGRGVEVRAGRSLDAYAEPMTSARCQRH
ncbi:MAG TPA: hypothetical protein VK735_18465 [Pseudonocardia sp.]|uniref:hypothetical protein n=1 Tax=Pseudonocardia sp. TaxID=60912 RepID=UPI002C9A41CC|nr:hypothetical protein [Pseudonocardia sp.]HTF49430.1 hypothetical protein [Pseudonocardia sp.]